MFPISVTSSAVFSQQMSMLDTAVSPVTTLSTSVAQTNMELLLRPRHDKKERRVKKFVITIMLYMPKFTSGSIATSTILEEPRHPNRLKSLKISLTTSRRRVTLMRTTSNNNTARVATRHLPIEWSVVAALLKDVDSQTPKEISAMVAVSWSMQLNSSTPNAQHATQLLLSSPVITFSST